MTRELPESACLFHLSFSKPSTRPPSTAVTGTGPRRCKRQCDLSYLILKQASEEAMLSGPLSWSTTMRLMALTKALPKPPIITGNQSSHHSTPTLTLHIAYAPCLSAARYRTSQDWRES